MKLATNNNQQLAIDNFLKFSNLKFIENFKLEIKNSLALALTHAQIHDKLAKLC